MCPLGFLLSLSSLEETRCACVFSTTIGCTFVDFWVGGASVSAGKLLFGSDLLPVNAERRYFSVALL